jgi:hypothetical protein
MESKDSNTSTLIEQFLKPKAVSSRKLARDAEGRLLMAEESALDMDRIRDAGVTVRELGRRVRLYNTDMTKQLAAYIIPVEVSQMTAESSELSVGAKVQIGRLIANDGTYLRHNPGIREIGTNDRGDLIVRLDAATAEDSTIGPVLNSYNTTQSTLSGRLVPRIDKKTHDRDVKEARAWLEAMNVLTNGKTLRTRFFSAGVACEHRGNIQQLYKTVQVNFFQVNDPLSLELSSVLEDRFRSLDRPVPMVRVISVVGIPPNERAYKEFVGQLKNKKQNPMSLGLPSRLRDSQFFDGASKSIAPSCFIYACTLDEIGDSIYIITINTDYHGEVKSRGIHSGVASAMSMGEVISAHASSAILSSEGSATMFMGVSDSGKSRAATFWSERNENLRRDELRRRYTILHQAKKVEKDPEELLKAVGILVQDDWAQVVPSGKHAWDLWPAERQFYMRSRDILSRSLILSENEPIIENATADFGAAGERACLGQTTHCYPDERLFYDGDWDNYHCDREVHRLSTLVLLENDSDLDYAVRRLSPKNALEHILRGGACDDENAQPFLNDYTDVSNLLMGQGVVGDRLLDAYKAAKKGDVAALMNGDEALGRVVLDKLRAQIDVWELFLADIPVFVVNTIHGDDMTQDIHWFASEFPDFLKPGREYSSSQFREQIEKQFKVRYDDQGNWSELG